MYTTGPYNYGSPQYYKTQLPIPLLPVDESEKKNVSKAADTASTRTFAENPLVLEGKPT